ncbi:hypothetical protein EST38_g2227 [Candolleomyces aberdarensis]|uniref:Major facilitator superfamily (MFS) profile domain-containing protein n=1 Tax=Candolleomyces aberdarensis TaxID=2316362 RepID=A0A4Q2DV55_9AGAR|nr:hypothetical protein EST38_g2227 [Candolleomyces aberdarensis]
MLNKLFSGRVGFHNGIRISAGLNVFLLLLSFALMRTRLPPKPVHHFPIRQWVFEQHEFTLALATCLFTFFALFFPVFYLQLNAITHGVDRNIAFYSLSILNACSVIGRLVPNAIAHKFGISNLIVLFTFLTGAVTLTFPAVKNLEGTILFAIFWGFVSGAFIALVPAYINIMSKDPSETGTRLGLFFGVGSIIGLFELSVLTPVRSSATPITGALLTDNYHWLEPSLFSGICFMIGGFLSLIGRNIIAKKRGTQLV